MCCVLCVRVCVGLELVCGCECASVGERECVYGFTRLICTGGDHNSHTTACVCVCPYYAY